MHKIEHLLVKQATEQVAATIIDSDIPSYFKFLYEYTLYKIRKKHSSIEIKTMLNCVLNNIELDKRGTLLLGLIYDHWRWNYTQLLNTSN